MAGEAWSNIRGVNLCDVTLRDGEQAVDAAFTVSEKLEVAARLDAIGVHQIQVGFPKLDGGATTRLIKKAGLKVPVELLCVAFQRDWKEQIDEALDSGADVLNILMRTSDDLLEFLGLSREQTLERTRESVSHAVSQGASVVTLGTSFSTQADPDFLVDICAAAASVGASRVQIADTMGISLPESMAELVRRLVSEVDVAVGIHCHDDFSLGVACTLAGLAAGATWADVSVNGVGERSGNTPLEATVMALSQLCDVDVGIAREGFYDLSRMVAGILGHQVAARQAVVGENAFAQKLDIHVQVASRRPELFEPYDPSLVGNQRRLRLGKGSGPFAVRAKGGALGIDVTDEIIEQVVAEVNSYAEQKKGYVPDEVFAEIVAGCAEL